MPPEHTDVFLHIVFHLDLPGNKKTYVSISSLCFHGNIAMVRGELLKSSLKKNCTMKNWLNETKEEESEDFLEQRCGKEDR